MSEENTPEEAQATETTEETPTPPATPAINLDSTVKVDGQEISIKDLISARDEATKLKEYNEKARMLITPDGTTDEQRESAVRFLMSKEGYSPTDIDEYINWTREATQEVANYDQTPPETPTGVGDDELRKYQEQLAMQEEENRRLEDIESRQQRMGAEMMKTQLSESLDRVFSVDENMQKLLSLPEADDNRKAVLMGEVESAMMEGLRNRRAAGESFNNKWFDEEAGKATKFVYDKFRSVIGDPDKIQRSPETAATESLFNKPPVDPPEFEKGDDMGSLKVKSHDWTLDTLLRGAQEGAAGGESKA